MLSYEEIKGWTPEQVEKSLLEKRKELFNLKMDKRTSGLEKPHLLRAAKKDLSRLETFKSSLAVKGQKK